MKFYDREKEQRELLRIREMAYTDMSRMTLVIGRRRIGKTVLIKHTLEASGDMLYLFIARKSESELVTTLVENLREQTEMYIPEGMMSFVALLRHLFEQGKHQAFTLVLDEFQEFQNINPSIFSDMQNLWDSYREKTHINLVISGSAYRMMQKIFMDKDEPLFNRADHIIRLQPFRTKVLKQILKDHNPDYTNDDLLALYTITGGVPKYMAWLLDNGCVTKEQMYEYVFSENSHFLEEGRTLLVSEFGKNYGTYFSILQEIASGYTTQAQIEQQLGGISVGGHLKTLDETYSVIKKERPILAKPESKTVQYLLNDNFLRFWFRYVEKNRSMIEIQNYAGLLRLAEKDYETYSGTVLERYFRQQLAETSEWRAISAWWRSKAVVYKGQTIDAEVDIVALPVEGKRALVAEVKRKREEYKHDLFMQKVDYLKQTDLRHYVVETRLLTLEEM